MDDLKDIRLLTPAEVADLLRISERTLRKYTIKGLIGHRRVGLKYMYTQRQVEEYIGSPND